MKFLFLFFTALVLPVVGISQNQNDEHLVKQTAHSWFNSFKNHDYSDLLTYTTEDCYMINPYGLHGKRTEDTPAMFTNAHKTFLKDLTINIDSTAIRFLTPDVAIATILSTQLGVYYVPPAGKVRAEANQSNGGLITTMVIVKQKEKWLITQYQHTMIASR